MANLNKNEEIGLLSENAEVFRSKLISDFHLLGSISVEDSGVKVESPCYYTDDVTDAHSLHKLLNTNPDGLVRIKGGACVASVPYELRRRNRIKNKNARFPVLDLWAHKVVSGSCFQNLVLGVILINMIVLGIQAEISDRSDDILVYIEYAAEGFDYFALALFILEIILKWMDQFWLFWKNYWNIFDFIVTVATLVPEFVSVYLMISSGSSGNASDLAVLASNLRTFRILRALKMVTRFNNVRLIVLAVTKAFQAMVFITALLIIFAYIFAIIGVIFFGQGYKNAAEGELRYKDSFRSIVDALITLFQLFTMDHWYSVYLDSVSTTDYFFAALFIILWILLGSLVFRNVFVGIMVNNFQTIRDDLCSEVQKLKKKERQEKEMMKFAIELGKQMRKMSKHSLEDTCEEQNSSERTQSALNSWEQEAMNLQLMKTDRDSQEWQNTVEQNLEILSRDDTVFFWPKDSLFQYFLMMEALMENMCERCQLYLLVGEALLQLHDTG